MTRWDEPDCNLLLTRTVFLSILLLFWAVGYPQAFTVHIPFVCPRYPLAWEPAGRDVLSALPPWPCEIWPQCKELTQHLLRV